MKTSALKQNITIILVLSLIIGLFLPVSLVHANDDVYSWIEEGQTPAASVQRDGTLDYRRINDGILNNTTNTWSFDKAADANDYYGYTFSREYTINKVVFYSARKYNDGGWFEEAPEIMILKNGEWVRIESEMSPEYTAEPFSEYTFSFDPVACDGVIVSGKPGGSARFISCAELKVAGIKNGSDDRVETRYEFERLLSGLPENDSLIYQWMGDYAGPSGFLWSRDYHILWQRTAEQSELNFSFDVARDGAYKVNIGTTAASDFGSFEFYIDDVKLGDVTDLYSESICPKAIEIDDVIDLTAGSHTFKIIGVNGESNKYFGGFDYFELTRYKNVSAESRPIASVVRDGDLALSNINDGILTNSTNLFEFNKTEDSIDYFGYEFGCSYTISSAEYYEGPHYFDGGWFRETPAIQILKDGQWTEIASTVTPEYDAVAGKKYVFSFGPVECDGIILKGKPGGSAYFTSCAELRILADDGGNESTPPEVIYSYPEIVSRLYDMEQLAKAPNGEKSAQFTSYDRSSYYDSVNGVYKNWDANGDWTGYLYKQADGGRVIAEMEGPGYINRMWMAYSWSGKVKIYIDGADTPVIDTEFRNLFNGNVFDCDELAYSPVKINDKMAGFDCYVPITYNKSCKVVIYDSATDRFGDFSYYIIGYTSLADNAGVESFTYPLSEENSRALESANNIFKSRSEPEDESDMVKNHISVEKGETKTLFEDSGENAVSYFSITPKEDKENFAETTIPSDLLLSIYWDGEESPSVLTTIGDFFGSPYGLCEYSSFVSGVTSDGSMYSRWFMPYSDSVKITVTNLSEESITFTSGVKTTPPGSDVSEYLRFGAQWKLMDDRDSTDPRHPDSDFLYLSGTGKFVGVSAHVFQIADGIWWGEGDEKFFVDGEKFPSWFGTGSEDYFGYAWCMPTIFNNAYHGQSLCEGDIGSDGVQNAGNKVNYRYHISDSIPFYSSFDASMEKYYNNKYVKMAATSFYYLSADDLADNRPGAFTAEEREFNIIGEQEPALFYEGEDLNLYITSISGGTCTIQNMNYATNEERKWSGGYHLWWRCPAADSELSFTVNIATSGSYGFNAHLTTAGDYGQIQALIDGAEVGSPADCYSAELGVSLFELGEVWLEAGQHTVTLKSVEKNQNSSGYYIGLDYIEFIRAASEIGDIDGNGVINVADVVVLRQLIMNGSIPDDIRETCDLTLDGDVTVADVVALRQKIMSN